MSNKTVKSNKSRSLLKEQFNPSIDSDDNDILELQRRTLKLIPAKFKIKDNRNIQLVSPPIRFSVEVEVEKCKTDDTIQNVFNSSGQEAHDANFIQVHQKYTEKQPSNNEEKVFYVRKVFSQETRKEKNYTIVKQYTITTETIMKAIEKQSKENTEESDKCLDIFSRNLHGHFGNITLSFYDEEVNTVMRIWDEWYRISPMFRGTPLMYKCYICCIGWWRLHPFKEHLKEHSDPHLKLGPEPIHDEFNVIAYVKQELKVKIVKIDSDCWKCGRDATFHQHNYTQPAEYECPGCNKCMTTCTLLKKHEGMCINNIKLNIKKYDVENNKGIICPVCKMHCVNEHGLDHHMVDYHLVRSDEPIVLDTKECKFCGGRYFICKFHDCPANAKSYKCDICCRSFSSLLIVQIHMKHSRGHVVKCTLCKKQVTQCTVPKHYLKHTKNYCLVYMCWKCDTDLLFMNETMYLTHEKIHSGRHPSRQMLLPTKCLNGEFVKSETTFRIPDVKLVSFLAGIVDSNGLPIDLETIHQREEIQCDPRSLTTPNITASNDDGDIIILDDDDDVNPSIESALNSETSVDKDFDIKVMQTQLDEEIMRDLEMEATICKVFQASKGYRLLMQKELLESKSEEGRLLEKKSKMEDLIEKESIKKDLLEKGSIEKESIPEESVKNELQEIEEEKNIQEFDLIIPDHDVEDVTIISDSEDERTPEDHSNTKIKCDFISSNKGSLESNKIKGTDLEPEDIVMDCNSSGLKQNLNRVTSTIVKEESLMDDDTIEVGPEVFTQEKITLESSDLNRKVYEDILQIIANNKNTTNTELKLYECNQCDYRGEWNCYIVHVSTECLGTDFNCNLCKRSVLYRNLNDYLQHLTKHDCKPLSCPECRLQHQSQEELHTHVRSHIHNLFSGTKSTELQEMPSYYCNKCGICVKIEHFFKHWQTHLIYQCSGSSDEDNPSECSSALNKCFRPEFIKEIMKILQLKSKKRPVNDCIVCSRTFERWDLLKRHLIEHLMVQAVFKRNWRRRETLKCFFCDEEFKKKLEWKFHMREHSHMRQYKCELCSKCFSDSSNYNKHRKVHNLYSYECDMCGAKYNRRHSLIQHLKLHEKPVPCKMCDMTFVSQGKLKKHLLAKHDTTYTCSMCAKKFMTWREKQTHMRHKHDTRNVTADCPICDKRFSRMLDMKTHMKLKHKTGYHNK